MAIVNSGKFVPLPYISSSECRDDKSTYGKKVTYIRDCRYHKEDPTELVRWLRRNFGERGVGWNFALNRGCVIIEIWDSKLEFMYEMWKN